MSIHNLYGVHFAVCVLVQLRGAYIARQLSFHGVSFQIKEVQLSEDFIDMYDAAVDIVSGHAHTFILQT